MKLRNALLLATIAALVVAQNVPTHAQGRARDSKGRFMAEEKAVCVILPVNKSGVSGVVFFVSQAGRVHIHGKISGLTPGKHGFHVHQFGDLTDEMKGESAGGHFNPHNMMHGAPDAQTRHAGDLGNVMANSDGVATIDQYDSQIKLDGPDSIIGRSIIVHDKADTFGQPTGNAGGRVGYGVIGWANPKSK